MRHEAGVTIVTIRSSMRDDEVRKLDQQAAELDTGRAGVIRSMLRFALEHETGYRRWVRSTEGQPVSGSERVV